MEKNFMFLHFDYPRQKFFYLILFFLSFGASIIGIGFGWILFHGEAGIISVFLTSFALLGLVNQLFEVNKTEIWEEVTSPYEANKMLGISLLVLFLGIFAGYGAVTVMLPAETIPELFGRQLGNYQNISLEFRFSQIDFGTVFSVFLHNLTVFLVVFFLSFFFRGGGLLLIITWNASVWGCVMAYVAKYCVHLYGFCSGCAKSMVATCNFFFHLLPESAGYVLCAMAGLFMSKACIKYYNDMKKLLRVTRASVVILIIGTALLFFAACIESAFTPMIISGLSK